MLITTSYRHIVYAALVRSCLVLEERDAVDVERVWGWSRREMCNAALVSMPSFVAKLIIPTELAKMFDLRGIAGFYFESDLWRMNLQRSRGLLLPYRDSKQKILGLMVYRDVNDRDPRLFDSRNLPEGAIAVLPERNMAFA